MPLTTTEKYGPKPSKPELILLGVGLVLRMCQSGVIQRGITYKQICEAAVRCGCTFADHSKGVRAGTAPACALACCHLARRVVADGYVCPRPVLQLCRLSKLQCVRRLACPHLTCVPH